MTNPSEVATKLRNLAKWLDRENDESTGNIAREAADTIDRLTSTGEAVAFATEAAFEGLRNGEMQAVMPVRLADRYKRDVGPIYFLFASPREGHVEDAEALRVAREVISDMVRYGLISNVAGTTAYYVGDNVLPTIMGRPNQGRDEAMIRRLVNIMDMPDPEAALLPCPFCGEVPEIKGAVIGCANIKCWGPYIWHMSNPADSVAAWNRRHPPASREEGLRVKALEWALRVGSSATFDANLPTGGAYTAFENDDGTGGLWVPKAGTGSERRNFPTVDAAKSAAQEHYTNAILSAIETSIIPTKPEAREEA